MAATEKDLLADLLNTAPGQGHVEYQRPEQAAAKAQAVKGYERSKPRKATKAQRFDYSAFTMRAAGLGAVLIWLGLWGIDGYFTASFVARVTGASIWVGAVAHVLISLVQQHLWRLGWREHWMLIVPISALNIGTTLIGLWDWVASLTAARAFDIFDMMRIDVPQSVVWFWLVVVGGIGIAVLPERKASQAAQELL